ncbi:hypothetical protein DB30_00080 [Enhygromyxa salina]|uniref:Protein NO VEIN C-terminal domain-containing protein n=1 Tax=Enhygromyxa salina TaxID=215803 RepID=A0A0C2D928_9BACT|nr:DUF3883 domain-containing protein [Enhygromyxa salina]KIG19571.1 hypothetical protein DB30_00080 [Enhygromyxa salina]
MGEQQNTTYSLLDADDRELAAKFSIEEDNGEPCVVFESAGDTKRPRNSDYNEALKLMLQRLGRARATLTKIEVASREMMHRPADELTFVPDGYPLPLALVNVEDYMDLRKKIGGAAGKTAQRPTAKPTSSGNPTKRLRLFLSFKPGPPRDSAQLRQIIRFAPKYDAGSPKASIGEDAPRTRTKRAGPSSGGQGFEQDPRTRLAVEEYAMRQAELHYATWQAQRRHLEKGLGYDIEFSRGDERLFVEVKGTQTPGDRVMVTNNEVEFAHANSERSVLFVVTNIEVSEDLVCRGGRYWVFERWDPKARERLLSVKDYWYELPKQESAPCEVEPGPGSAGPSKA